MFRAHFAKAGAWRGEYERHSDFDISSASAGSNLFQPGCSALRPAKWGGRRHSCCVLLRRYYHRWADRARKGPGAGGQPTRACGANLQISREIRPAGMRLITFSPRGTRARRIGVRVDRRVLDLTAAAGVAGESPPPRDERLLAEGRSGNEAGAQAVRAGAG